MTIYDSHNEWAPENGLLGFTRLQQGLATALRRWLLHVLDRAEDLAPNVIRDRFEDWVRPLVEIPEASYDALLSVCERVLGDGGNGGADDDWTRARREVLSNLVTYVITSLSNPPSFTNRGAYTNGDFWQRGAQRITNATEYAPSSCNAPRLRCLSTWAVAYAELARAWQLVPKGSETEEVIFKCTQTTPVLHAAVQRALMEDTHATGTLLPPHQIA